MQNYINSVLLLPDDSQILMVTAPENFSHYSSHFYLIWLHSASQFLIYSGTKPKKLD